MGVRLILCIVCNERHLFIMVWCCFGFTSGDDPYQHSTCDTVSQKPVCRMHSSQVLGGASQHLVAVAVAVASSTDDEQVPATGLTMQHRRLSVRDASTPSVRLCDLRTGTATHALVGHRQESLPYSI
jgi:hypothetical protein